MDRKNRKKKLKTDGSVSVHIRRCHICGGMTETHGHHVSECEHCGKAMAPFYFFKEEEAPLYSDHDLRPVVQLGERKPVLGFTAYW